MIVRIKSQVAIIRKNMYAPHARNMMGNQHPMISLNMMDPMNTRLNTMTILNPTKITRIHNKLVRYLMKIMGMITIRESQIMSVST